MFFWRHKFLTLAIILGFVYWHYNPARSFGVVRPEVIIYNRIPIAFMDFYIDTTGKPSLIGDLRETNVFSSWLSGRETMQSPLAGSDFVLVVGTGFGPKPSFVLPDSLARSLKERRISVDQAPTPRAAEIFNACRKQGRRVAALMRGK